MLARFTFYLKIKLTAFADGFNAVVEKERRERGLKNKNQKIKNLPFVWLEPLGAPIQ